MPQKKAGPEKGKKIARRVNMSHPSAPGPALRNRAEEKLKSEVRKPQSEDLHKLSNEESQRLVHELRTHQIELEMQNEDLRKAQEELTVSQRRYSDFYDFAPVGFFTFDGNGLIVEVNLPGARLLNFDRLSLINKPFPLFVDKEDRNIFLTYLREVFINQEMRSCEIRLGLKNVTIYAQLQSIAVEDNEDGTVFCKTVISDITPRRRAEAAVQSALGESRQRQAEVTALLDASRAVMEQREFKDTARLIFNSCKALIGATAGYVALLSKDGTENEVLFLDSGGLPCTVDPSLPMPVRGLREAAYRTGNIIYENDFSHSEWERFMPKGHTRLENVLFAPLIINGEAVGLLGLGNKPGGFTENDSRLASAFRKLASIALYNSRLFELLKTSEEKFRSVAQTASDAIISVDSGGRIIFWNSGAERIFGYRPDEVTDGSIALIIPERSIDGHLKGMKRVLSTGVSEIIGKSIETTGLKRDGSEFPVELSLARWETGEGVFFTAIIREITERKRMEEERERLLKELERSNADLEQFAYVASHDLQEPLRMVKSYMQLIRDRYKDKLDRDAGEFMDFAVNGAAHMQTLIHDLLAYSRVGSRSEPFALTDLNVPLRRALTYLRTLIADSGAEIKSGDLPAVNADETQMVQLFQNLIGNAIKFRGSGPPRVLISSELKENEWTVRVSDNGIGIDPRHYDRIFDVFKRLHSADKYPGTGIGLAVCRKIVERHGGRIWVESELGKGTAFYFALPATGSS